MIASAGLPTANFDDDLVALAFNAYRDKDDRAEILAALGRYQLVNAKIKMIGVWDTVGSLGIPAFFGGVDPPWRSSPSPRAPGRSIGRLSSRVIASGRPALWFAAINS